MDEEGSRSSITDEEDYVEDNDDGADYEGTIEEEELLDDGDYADELKDLEDEGEMSLEELQRKYGYQPVGATTGQELNNEGEEDVMGESSSAPVETFDATILDMGNSLSGLDDDDEDYAPPDPWKHTVTREEDTILWRSDQPNQPIGELIEYYYQWKLTPSYRVWRNAHPQHAPVVQPHLSAAWHQQSNDAPTGPTSFAESFTEPSTSAETSTLTN
ncbi:hypothetical protein CAEBREN_26250 [Caenorhabditis brenneri]|uniref:ELM2 domain-containing protein n=1 Tax=Caenorhabditis brenneri TaxID=135651 RepID=G0N9R6_CAEBE|nr:hypothetical protein CAEBREN_26250 [Caenorhabditis brenneri]